MGTLDYNRFADALLEGTKALIAKELAPLRENIAEMQAVQARSLHFMGQHSKAVPYDKGALVVHSGQPWVAVKAASEGDVPGRSDSWQLLLKAEAAR